MSQSLCQENHLPVNSPVSEGLPKVQRGPQRHAVTGRWVGVQRKPKPCEHCGQEFQPLVDTNRFCSNRCAGLAKQIPIHKRLWPRIKIEDNGCWIWQGGKDQDGYGSLRWGKEQRAHRIAWILSFGAIPEGVWVLHHCDNPPCCNPLHLFLGDPMINNHDMISKGRANSPKGEKAGGHKLSEKDVLAIRDLFFKGVNQREIAMHFPVGFKAINKIVHKQRWKHI